MSESTPLLGLPFILAAQAQKHVTHNEALLGLDALVQLSVLSRVVADPPASPQEGDRYLVAASATGDWAAMEDTIAAFQDGIWRHYSPMPGWRVWIDDESRFLVYDGTQWRRILADADLQNLSLLGINTAADATNKLAVKSDAVLFDNAGADAQVKVNKAAAGDTASHLFQTGYSGRAEFGLTGDDDFHAKVSPDGATWYDGLVIDKNTGIVTFPNGIVGESGTFTPTAAFSVNGDFSPTYNAQIGRYRRYGDLVFFWCYLNIDTNAYTTPSGQFRLGGLPFTAIALATSTWMSVGPVWTRNVTFNSATNAFTGVVTGGTTYMELGISTNNAVSTRAGTLQVIASKADMGFWFAGAYLKA